VPEGDTVWLAAKHLHEALAGREVMRSDFRVPQLATVDLAGEQVVEVRPRGKHLLTRFSGGRTLHTHFRLDGAWHLYRPGERWRGGPDHEVRVVLEVPDRVAVGYRLPVVELVPTTEEAGVVGHLGPDLLTDDWSDADTAEAVRRLRESPDREVRTALLDQRNLAGLGNLYANELCFLRGVSPWSTVRQVDDGAGLDRAVLLGRRLMMANRDTAAQVTTGDRRRGHQHWVHGRARQPCLRCGTPIRSAPQGDPGRQRTTYWCPTCQP
jgi:endonuclease-8